MRVPCVRGCMVHLVCGLKCVCFRSAMVRQAELGLPLQNLAARCMDTDPELRPTFPQILEELGAFESDELGSTGLSRLLSPVLVSST